MADSFGYVVEVIFFDPATVGERLGVGERGMTRLPNVGDKLLFSEEFSNEAGVPTDAIWTVAYIVHNHKEGKFQVCVIRYQLESKIKRILGMENMEEEHGE